MYQRLNALVVHPEPLLWVPPQSVWGHTNCLDTVETLQTHSLHIQIVIQKYSDSNCWLCRLQWQSCIWTVCSSNAQVNQLTDGSTSLASDLHRFVKLIFSNFLLYCGCDKCHIIQLREQTFFQRVSHLPSVGITNHQFDPT